MLILIDQDGVLADFECGFHTAWQACHHAHPPLPLEQRRNFYVRNDYPEHLRSEVEAIYTARGFYRNLPPVAGAIEGLTAMLARGHEVRICTSPLNAYQYCVPEKYEWVEQHLGAGSGVDRRKQPAGSKQEMKRDQDNRGNQSWFIKKTRIVIKKNEGKSKMICLRDQHDCTGTQYLDSRNLITHDRSGP